MPMEDGITIGNPQEWREFHNRHQWLYDSFPRLKSLLVKVFGRDFSSDELADKAIYALGRVAAGEFMEILVLCANSQGIGGMKILRSMFERVVTTLYLGLHLEEVTAFSEYHHVHQHKLINHARSAGIDLREYVSEETITQIEENYKRVKNSYLETVCRKCKSTRPQMSWTRRSLPEMAQEVGLGRLYVTLYFAPTLQVHTTVSAIEIRLEEQGEGAVFKGGPQREESDYALMGGFACLHALIEGQNRYFDLGLAAEVEWLAREIATRTTK